LVTGEFGGSIHGKQFGFTPRVEEALWLAENVTVHAAIDVSDGLSLDLSRMCEASGCGAMVEVEQVPVSEAAKGHENAPEHALSDGEDFELILAVPADVADDLVARQPLETTLTRIGAFIAEPGLFSVNARGERHSLAPRGYEHRLD
jgi:thiamine-monophosphate kinase